METDGIRKKRGLQARAIETATELLAAAIEKGDDFVLTYETYTDTGKRDMHQMVGKLISPCLLGTQNNKVEIRVEEGSRRVSMRWKQQKESPDSGERYFL